MDIIVIQICKVLINLKETKIQFNATRSQKEMRKQVKINTFNT